MAVLTSVGKIGMPRDVRTRISLVTFSSQSAILPSIFVTISVNSAVGEHVDEEDNDEDGRICRVARTLGIHPDDRIGLANEQVEI